MNVNLSSEFSGIIDFIVTVFRSVVSWLDSIIIIGDNTSLLDLNIAFTVFTIIIAAVFSVVRADATNSMTSVDSARAAAKKRSERSNTKSNNKK